MDSSGTDTETELAWLRSENALLRVERDMLLRLATDFHALEKKATMTRTAWLTPHAHERLRAELTGLLTAGPGDELDDPAGLRHRRRVRELQDLLTHAVVGEDPPDDGVAEPGMVLTVRFTRAEDTETFLLGTRTTGDEDLEVCSPESPIGAALIGARRGEQRTYQAPSGDTFQVTLLDAVPYGHHRLG